jgi:hypothetical protein
VLRWLIGLILVAGAIAFGVQQLTNDRVQNHGPTVVTVQVPNPLGGGNGGGQGGGGIYVP